MTAGSMAGAGDPTRVDNRLHQPPAPDYRDGWFDGMDATTQNSL